MGLSYFYANHDKEQFFNCGLFGTNDRFSAVGSGPGSRALAILLSRGSWMGDRISVISDASKEFDELAIRGINVKIEAELMLIEFDGLIWLEERLDLSILAFERACCYALLLRHPQITEMLNRKYGIAKWQQRYKNHLQGNTDLWSKEVIDAKNRGLNLLKQQTVKE